MYCCTECFSDEVIQDFIKGYDEIDNCDYCSSGAVNVADAKEVGKFIIEGINRKYEDPGNQVGYCSAEGGYNIEPIDIDEILTEYEEIFSDKIDDPSELINALVPDNLHYVHKDPYGPPPGESDQLYGWERFCKLVKATRRYTSFLPQGRSSLSYELDPAKFMKSLVSSLATDHFDIFIKGTKIYRGRLQKENEKYEHVDLTCPPPGIARNNRMSPSGISLFYGSLDPETCISELRPGSGERIVIAEFETIKDLTILDLSLKTRCVQSIFNEDYSYEYERWTSFLQYFASDISRPIRPMDQEVDYVPTQVFTEFLRLWDFKDLIYVDVNEENKPFYIDGMQFSSSLREGGINVVLFRGPEISLPIEPSEPWLSQKEYEPWLSFKGTRNYEVTGVVVKSEQVRLKKAF